MRPTRSTGSLPLRLPPAIRPGVKPLVRDEAAKVARDARRLLARWMPAKRDESGQGARDRFEGDFQEFEDRWQRLPHAVRVAMSPGFWGGVRTARETLRARLFPEVRIVPSAGLMLPERVQEDPVGWQRTMRRQLRREVDLAFRWEQRPWPAIRQVLARWRDHGVDFDSDNVSRIFKVALKTARSVMESEPLRSLLAMGHVEPARLLNAATGSALYLAIEDHVADVLADESGGKMPEHLINAPERLQTADGRCISVPAKYAEVFKGAKLVPFDEVSGVTMYATSDSAATRGTRALEMLGAVDARSAVGFLQAVVFADSPIPHGMFDPPQKTAFVLSDGAEALDSGLDLLTCQILIEEHRHSTQPPELLPFVQEADALAFVALSQEQLRRAFAKRGENLATLFPHAERTTHLRARDFWTRVNSSLPVQRFTWDHGVATAARVNVQWAGLLALSNAEKR